MLIMRVVCPVAHIAVTDNKQQRARGLDMAFPPDYLQPVDGRAFKLGMIYAFTEAVASGCKPLAFSPPLDPEEYVEALRGALLIAEEYGTAAEGEDTPLDTLLFNPEFTRGKLLVLMAADEAVLDSYHVLKARKRAAASLTGEPRQAEEIEIARGLGSLLGYGEDAVEGLLRKPRF